MKFKDIINTISTGNFRIPFLHGKSILFRTLFMIWLLIIIILGLYILFTVPYQRQVAIERMKLQAQGIASSISEVTANAILLEDYSFTVDHCMRIINENPSIDYIVITKRNGFSLYHRFNQWKTDTLGGYWINPKLRNSLFIKDPNSSSRVFHYSSNFSYSGIEWGWIHIGLNIIQYNKEISEIYLRSAILALLCIVIGMGISVLFARNLVAPIHKLQSFTVDFAAGNLQKRIALDSGDELQQLADSFNLMADALQLSHKELENRVKDRTKKLARANSLLKKEITERKEAEKVIKASLLEKEILLSEIHHRVKNNLQIVSSLLYLQSRNIKDEYLLAQFLESQNRIRSMALIHEKLYQSKSLANINFADYIQTLSVNLFHTYNTGSKDIDLITDIDDATLSIEQAICCGLIVNELVSNSLKYAFRIKKSGKIIISLKKMPSPIIYKTDHYIFSVRDNGDGIAENITFQNSPSLGLQLVQNLTNQLNGTVQMIRDGGTIFNIIFVPGKHPAKK